jgi:hypothetical protein
MKSGRWPEAIAQLKDLIDVMPKENVGLRQRRIRAARTISDWETTVRDLESIVDDIDPAAFVNDELSRNALVNNELAWLLANCKEVELRHPARAVELAQKAVELVPGNGSGPPVVCQECEVDG